MRLLVAGRSGQVAQALAHAELPQGWSMTALGRPELDITDPGAVRAHLEQTQPDIVINAAAYTAVDKAESEPEQAFAVNRDGAKNLAEAATESGAPIIHLSTDYVFAGNGTRPYRETDPVGPTGVYGRSKLDGEQAVARANPRHVILRTAWVHSPWGGNFVKTLLRLGVERKELNIVADQMGTPTYAPDLAGAIVNILSELSQLSPGSDPWGVYNVTDSGQTTWFGFAEEIFRRASQFGFPKPELKPVSTAEYPTPAKRPGYSVLDTTKITNTFGVDQRYWKDGVADCVAELLP